MPSGKSLLKVSKQVSKSNGVVHPKGRKFAKLNKAHLRELKVEKKRSQHMDKREHQLQRLLFFQEAVQNRINDEKNDFTFEEVKLFIEAYLSRFDEELTTLRKQRRKGRPMPKRQEALEGQTTRDQDEYRTGFKVPVLNNSGNVENLIKWNGTIGGITNIKFHFISNESTDFPGSEQDEEMGI